MRKLFCSGFWNVRTLWITENTRTWALEMVLQWQELGPCTAHQGLRKCSFNRNYCSGGKLQFPLTWHIMCLTCCVSPITVGSTTYIVENADGFLQRMQQAQQAMLGITKALKHIPVNAIIFKPRPYYLEP